MSRSSSENDTDTSTTTVSCEEEDTNASSEEELQLEIHHEEEELLGIVSDDALDEGENNNNLNMAAGGEKTAVKVSKGPSWNGNKLFPPRRKSSKPSKAWTYGGFRKGRDGFLIMEKTVCGICGKEQKYRNTPTNLTQHLQVEHIGVYDCDKSTDSAPKIKDYFKPSSKKPKYKHDHP